MLDFLDLVRRRKSFRVPFDKDRPVSAEDLAVVLEAARWSPSAHNMQNWEIVVVDDPIVLDEIAGLGRTVSATFIRENYQQLSFSEEEFLSRKTGLLASIFPLAWLAPDFKSDAADGRVPQLQRAFPPSTLLLVVLYDPSRRAPASEGDFLGIISLGCLMENMWLAAESRGLAMHIVSSLNDAPEVRTILGVPDNLVIAYSVRLGYLALEPAGYLRVRRDVRDFTHRNRYGG